ncbi:MAG: hypothetical protein ABI867_22955 [Kofleriaceae bacterium]
MRWQVVLAVVAACGGGEAANLIATIPNPDPHLADDFGVVVDFGPTFATLAGLHTIYLYDSDTGDEIATIQDPSGLPDEAFGIQIRPFGDQFIVASFLHVYQFDAGTGGLVREVFTPLTNIGDIAVVGDSFVVASTDAVIVRKGSPDLIDIANPQPGTALIPVALGARFALLSPGSAVDGVAEAGVVYLHDGQSGTRLATIANPDLTTKRFGESISDLGANFLVSADVAATLFDGGTNKMLTRFTANGPATSLGATFVIGQIDGGFELRDSATGALIRAIPNPDPSGSFPQFLSLGATFLAAMPFSDSDGMDNVGSAFLYDSTTGELIDALTAPGGQLRDAFGFTTARVGTRVLVGAPGRGVLHDGAVFQFDATTGADLDTIENPQSELDDGFGLALGSVGASGNFVVGALTKDTGGVTSSGAMYLYRSP